MAYAIYTTRALVCGSFDRNAADRSYRLFTERAGMLYASARSVRAERSRQRYALQDFSLVRVSLVKGKQGWRIGSVEPLHNYYHLAVDKSARGSVVRLLRLLRRFLRGEAPEPELFSYVVHALPRLSGTLPDRATEELVTLVHCLQLLGYVDADAVPAVARTGHLTETVSTLTPTDQARLRKLYETAVTASQL